MTEGKLVRLSDFLTKDEIVRAITLYVEAPIGTFADRCDAEIIAPVLGRINAALGQENNSRYLAYVVELSLMAKRPAAPSVTKREDKT